MESSADITQIIIDTINTIFETLFSSIDNNLYSVLDEITFINSDILYDKNFETLFGTSTSNGILLIANSLLLGFILYYSARYLIAHFTYTQSETPLSFIIKLIKQHNIIIMKCWLHRFSINSNRHNNISLNKNNYSNSNYIRNYF